jgi:hypothetical protein
LIHDITQPATQTLAADENVRGNLPAGRDMSEYDSAVVLGPDIDKRRAWRLYNNHMVEPSGETVKKVGDGATSAVWYWSNV